MALPPIRGKLFRNLEELVNFLSPYSYTRLLFITHRVDDKKYLEFTFGYSGKGLLGRFLVIKCCRTAKGLKVIRCKRHVGGELTSFDLAIRYSEATGKPSSLDEIDLDKL